MNIPSLHPYLRACLTLALATLAWATMPAHAGAAADHGARHARHTAVGIASVYAKKLDGLKTASGEAHDSDDLVAAHRTLPLGSEVRVTNLSNHRSVVVRINDRGPAVRSRIIDLSPRAAAAIGLRAHGKGVTRVRLDVLREGEGKVMSASAADAAQHASTGDAR